MEEEGSSGSVSFSLLQGSRPVPEFNEDSPFCPRKRVPFRATRPPSWAPAKLCPRVSRIYHPRDSSGPQLVSFKEGEKKQSVLSNSKHYDSQSNRTYFEQCFEIREKLGEGSFGEVFRVCSLEDGKMYAIKRTLEPFRGGLDRQLKLKEVEKHEHLSSHPNCVRFCKAWEERGRLYIQTELCEMSLSEYADLYGKVPEKQIWHILLDLVKGLKHLHDHRLCHLDIKPANVFLGQDKRCKVGDFGLCSSLDHGLADAVEGDSKYLAPELMSNQFGLPADIFSLGISLLELACDVELPSGGDKWHLLRSGHLPVDLVEGLSPQLTNLLSRMMHPDPSQRPTVDDILSERCVMLHDYQQSCYRVCYWTLSRCRLAVSSLWALVVFLYGLFPALKRNKVGDSGGGGDSVATLKWNKVGDSGGGGDSVATLKWNKVGDSGGGGGDSVIGQGSRVSGGLANLHNHSFSDEEELLQLTSPLSSDDGVDPNAKFNRSWIRHSPMKYPKSLYAGPPIPIDFSECGVSPVVLFRSSPSGSSLSASCSRTGSPEKPPTTTPRSLNVEPRRLIEAFDDL